MTADPLPIERLHPDPGPVTIPELLAGVRPGERPAAQRPHVFLNMVVSVDGRAALDGRSRGLGDDADTLMFGELRVLPDAVMIGSGTLRAERYGRLVRDPERRARRVAAGLEADPVAVLVSRGLDLPWDAPLFAAPEQEVVVYTGQDGAEPPDVDARLDVVRLPDPGHRAALAHLRSERGVRSVLCEGGPTLNGRLLADDLVDELFLTTAPLLAGDTGEPGLVAGQALSPPAPLDLVWVLRHGSELFLRYAVRRADTASER